MGTIINCTLLIFGVITFMVAVSFYLREKNMTGIRLYMLLLGICCTLWCGGYAAVGFCEDMLHVVTYRAIGLAGVLGFSWCDAIMIGSQTKIPKKIAYTIYAILAVIAIGDWWMYSNPNVDYFVREQGRTVFYASDGFYLTHFCHYAYIVGMMIMMFIFGILWYQQKKYKRDKRFVVLMFVSHFGIIFISFFDTVLPVFTKVSLPFSGIGASITFLLMWYFATQYNSFSISVEHMGNYVFDTVQAGFLIFDLDGNVILANPFIRKLWNIQEEEINATEVFGVSMEKMIEIRDHILATGSYEMRFELYDGKIACKAGFSKAEDEHGEPYCILCTIYDLTKEEMMVRELETANRVKNDFLSNVTHEIRTPLHSVLSYNEMIMKESNDSEVSLYALQANTSAKSLLGLIDDILDYIRLEDKTFILENKSYHMQSLLQDTLLVAKESSAKKGLDFEVDIDENIPCKLEGDFTRIYQILNNVISNAFKYTMEGKVSIRIYWEEKEPGYGKLCAEIKDTGIGMKEEDLARINEDFERFDAQHTRNVSGLGLGMTIVTRLLAMMDGELKVESKYQEGTTVSFWIPQKISDMHPIGPWSWQWVERMIAEDGEEVYFYAPTARVLAVDDNQMNLDIVKRMMKATQVQLEFAENGLEAIKKIENQDAFDVILMDHMMPVMDGVEAFKEIKERHLCDETKVVVFTANSITGSRAEYIEMGFDEYINKPIDNKRLLGVMEKLIPREKLFYEKPEEEIVSVEELVQNIDVDEVMKVLSQWLDVDMGLGYSMEDPEFYLEMISTYVKQSKVADMKHQYEEKDWENYRITVHALKSTSLSIGAEALSQEAKGLEFAARDKDVAYIAEHHDQVMEEYIVLLEQLQAILKNPQEMEADMESVEVEIKSEKVAGKEISLDISHADILVVDDTYMYLQLMQKMLSEQYNVTCVDSAKKALDVLDKQNVDLVLLDVHMPDISGLDALKIIRENDAYKNVPVILLTADEDQDTEQQGFKEGAIDFIRKPFNNTIVMQRIRRVLELAYLQNFLKEEVAKQTKTAEDRRLSVERMSRQMIGTIANSLDAKDPYTNGHSQRVAKYSVMLAEKMGYDEDSLNQVHYAALLHDVGKIGIPDAIINKASGLSDEEYEIIKSHPVTGAKILSEITEIPNIALGAKWHHERYDGKGYPEQLQGEEIPEIARIIGVADTYDAMASKRSYRDVLPQEVVREEIEKGKGTQFDPKIADLMIELIDADTEYELRE